jgi:hypothetical protein
MRKFSKINESNKLDRSDIDKVNDILSDFKDESKFTVGLDWMATNGLPYCTEMIPEIPEGVNTFNWAQIVIHYKNNSKNDEFSKEFNFFNENILNAISHLESIGKVFFKINTEYVTLIATIKIFPN